jgi:hypothetical protein
MDSAMDVFVNMLAAKVTGAFSKARVDAASKKPLCDFFTIDESTGREESIAAFVCSRVEECLERLCAELVHLAAITSQERLELARGKEVRANNFKGVATQLALKLRDGKVPTEEEAVNIAGALNELLGSLDATVRKALAEIPSKFIIKYDSYDESATKYAEGIGMVQYFDALAEQWNKKTANEGGETNGAILLRRDEVYGKELAKLRKKLLQEMDGVQVEQYYNDLRATTRLAGD